MDNALEHMSNTPRAVRASHVIPGAPLEQRVDVYAAGVFDELASRRAAYRALKAGHLLVDGSPASPNDCPEEGQLLELLWVPRKLPILELSIEVVFEDDWLAVIDKPAGIAVSGNRSRTVSRALPFNLAPSPRVDALPQPWPVHRLDAATRGVLLVAKSAAALVQLGQAFEQRDIRKQYRAIAAGRLDGEGEICEPIDGREALTHFRVVGHTPSLNTEWTTTLDLWPHTGRTHQLRRHLAGLGHPIVGDTLYGEQGNTFRGKGLFLCAISISFAHPADGRRMDVSVPEPAKFESYRSREERRWQKYNP